MTTRNGGGASSNDGRLAPVIPLFRGRGTDADSARTRPSEDAPARPSTDAEWRSTWAEESAAERRGPSSRHPAAAALAPRDAPEHGSGARSQGRTSLRVVAPHGTDDVRLHEDPAYEGTAHEDRLHGDLEREDPVADAEEFLVRRLRARQLSRSEAVDALREYGVPNEHREVIVDEFERRGYLDDASLAELLVTSGSQRKGQGRVVIARTLSQRGIPREIADEALSVLEDDDAERALEYARSKVSGMRRYDEDTAIRRLVGQLSRRGYGGSVALNAARTAWRETQRGSGVGRVRFEES